MRRVINSNIVAANAFISTDRTVLKKDKIVKYVDTVTERSNYVTDSFITPFDVTKFASQLDFAFCDSKDKNSVYIHHTMRDFEVLDGYFRSGIPEETLQIMNDVGNELIDSNEFIKQRKKTISRYSMRGKE